MRWKVESIQSETVARTCENDQQENQRGFKFQLKGSTHVRRNYFYKKLNYDPMTQFLQ